MKNLLLIAVSLFSTITFARSPIMGEAVPTKFDCQIIMGKQLGSGYTSVTKQITHFVNSSSSVTLDLSSVLDLPENLVDGFISLKAGKTDKKYSSILVRTPSLKSGSNRVYSQSGDSAKGIDGKELRVQAGFVSYDVADNSKSVILNITVSCDLTEI